LFDLSSIKVFKLNGEFICEAKRVEPIHPLANYLGNVKDIEDLKQKTKIKKKLEKRTEQEYINHLKRVQVHTPLLTMDLPEKLEEDNIQQFISDVQNDTQLENFNECFQRKFEKYEYLLTKSNLSKAEQDWIAEYKLTDEYNDIYGEDNKEVFDVQIICKNSKC
jgi:hypothetical protein